MENINNITWIQDPLHTTASTEFTTSKPENLIESCDNIFKAKYGINEIAVVR